MVSKPIPTRIGNVRIAKNGNSGGYLVYYPNRFYAMVSSLQSALDYVKVLKTKI